MDYSEYLQGRHPLSFPYRRYLVYPYYRSLLPGKALEVGCGLGEFLDQAPGMLGVELNPKLVAVCQQKGLDVKEGSAYAIPYPDETFDSLMLDNVFEHLDEPEVCLNEILRVLKPGGRLLLALPNQKGYATDSTHVRYWNEANLPSFIEKQGFKLINSRNYPIPFKGIGNLFWPYNCFLCLGEKTAPT